MSNARQHWHRRRRGLTLLEVVVAMAVLAIGITAVLGAISAFLRANDGVASYSRGVGLAQQVVAELERNDTLDPGPYEGSFNDIAPGYTWTAQIATADDEGLYPVRVTVLWANETCRYTLDTSLRPHARPGPPAAEESGGGNGANAGANTGAGANPGGAGVNNGGAGANNGNGAGANGGGNNGGNSGGGSRGRKR